MAGIKGRIYKLYAVTISNVTSKITVIKDEKVIKQVSTGNNKQKVIEIVIRL